MSGVSAEGGAARKGAEAFDEAQFGRAYAVATSILHWDEVTALYPSHNIDGNPAYLQGYNTIVAYVIEPVKQLETQGIVATIPAPAQPQGETQ